MIDLTKYGIRRQLASYDISELMDAVSLFDLFTKDLGTDEMCSWRGTGWLLDTTGNEQMHKFEFILRENTPESNSIICRWEVFKRFNIEIVDKESNKGLRIIYEIVPNYGGDILYTESFIDMLNVNICDGNEHVVFNAIIKPIVISICRMCPSLVAVWKL